MPIDSMDREGLELFGAIITANVDAAASTTNRLIDLYEREIAELKAERALVRDRIEQLIYGPYAPSGHAIERALYPLREEIERLAAQKEEN